MEFNTPPKNRLNLGITAVVLFSAMYIWLTYTIYINLNDINRLLEVNITKNIYLSVIWALFMLLLYGVIRIAMGNSEKAVIGNDKLAYFRKSFKEFKEIDNILISDISHIRAATFDDKRKRETIYGYYIVDMSGKLRFKFDKDLRSEEGKQLFGILNNKYGIKVKKEPILWLKYLPVIAVVIVALLFIYELFHFI